VPRNTPFTAIDVGTTKICTLVADLDETGDIEIIGVGITPAQGLRKGIVVSVEETIESIRASVEKAQRSSGHRISSAHVGVAGSHISSLNNRSIVTIARHDRLISQEDVARALESARTVSIPANREVIHVIPRGYILDGQEGVRNPVGMHGFRLDVETHIITGATTSIQNLTKCVQGAGIEINDLVLEPVASSEAVLEPAEKEMGVVLADIGGGTTDVAIFMDGGICHTAVLPVGGNHLSNDIAIGLRTSFGAAEELKTRYGYAIASVVDGVDNIQVASFGTDGNRTVPQRHLCEIIQARVEEILNMTLDEIKRSGYQNRLPAGLVLTGGVANLRGIDALARDVLQMPVRIGTPKLMRGLVDAIHNPAYATSIGLLIWGLKHGEIEKRPRKKGGGIMDVFKRFTFWIRELIPQ